MALLKKLKKIIEDADYEFYYDTGNGLNDLLDNADFEENKSIIYCYLLGNTKLTDGMESGNVALFFCRKTDFDFDTIENEKIIEGCLKDVRKIEIIIKRGNVLRIESDILLERFYDNFSINLTGMAMNVNLSETYGLSECIDGTIYELPEEEETEPEP